MALGLCLARALFACGAPGEASAEAPALPISISASEEGRFVGPIVSWQLDVDSSGEATLQVGGEVQSFSVSPAQLEELRREVAAQDFFELADRYGQLVPDSSTTTLSVTLGAQSHTVQIRYLMNWISDPEKLQEPARALRVLMVVRGWFDHPRAVDLRPYDQRVIDAAG